MRKILPVVAELQRDAEVVIAQRRMASCRSSFDGEVTRTWSPWIAAWTFFSFLSLRNFTISRAASIGMPSWMVIDAPHRAAAGRLRTRRTLKFLIGTPRRTSRVCTISHSAFILNSSSAISVSVFSVALRSIRPWRP